MDWGRYQRAMDVRMIEVIEMLRIAQIEKGIQLTPEQWERIKKHDKLMTLYE